ncbi:MAG: Rieske 2Fe-2S domain-containing protein [Ferruginibacter sp.]|nr:Rieske 2Fe-2S domain-containing protein [Ferruginibacter sp.]
MQRKEFINALGVSTATLLLATCFGGCSKASTDSGNTVTPPSPPPTNVDFLLDLTLNENANLATNGGFVYKNGIIIARTTTGSYIAVSMACTHQGTTVVYQGNNNQFFCNNHGSTFSNTGTVNNGPATTNLRRYNTTLTGSMLRVFA